MTKAIEVGEINLKDLDLLYSAHIESKEAVSSDGVILGLVRGILIDAKTWTIPYLVIALKKEALKGLKLEKSLPGELVTVPTKFVKAVSLTIELNAKLASMKDSISELKIERT